MAEFWSFSIQTRRSDHFSPLNRNECWTKEPFWPKNAARRLPPLPLFGAVFSAILNAPPLCWMPHSHPEKKKNWKHKIGNKKVSATLRLHLVFKYSPLRKYKVPPTLRIVTSINHRSVCMCVCASFWLVTQNAADDHHHHHHHRSITSPTLYILYNPYTIRWIFRWWVECRVSLTPDPSIPRFLDSLAIVSRL